MPEVPAVWRRIEEELDAKSDDFSSEDIERLRDFFLSNFDEILYNVDDVRLARFSTRFFKAIGRTETINFHERSTYLYGPNSKGKTSLIKAIQFNIAGIPEGNEDKYGMRNLVHGNSDQLSTIGFWQLDEKPHTLERNLLKTGRGGKRKEYDSPYLREGFVEEADSVAERMKNPEKHIGEESISNKELLTRFGLYELKKRGHSPFKILSLFFLMGEDFKQFFGDNSQFIDLLFGISVSQVVDAIDEKIDDLELREEEANAQGELTRYRNKRENLEGEIGELKSTREQKINRLTQFQDRRDSIDDTLGKEDQLKNLENRRDELRGRRADLKVRLEETTDELGQIKRLIERHDSTELHQDLSGIADDLRNLMTVPDTCPVCTNEVDAEQRSRLVDNGDCPLCAKEMPEERMLVEHKYQSPDSLTDSRLADEDDIQDYREKKRELEGEQKHLRKQISDLEEELESVQNQLRNSEVKDLAEEKTAIRDEIDQLRKEIFDIESDIEHTEEELQRIDYEIRAQKRLLPRAKKKQSLRDTFKKFKPIVKRQRKKRRESEKRKLEEEIEQLLEVFDHGTFAEAHNPRFEEGDTYHYTIQTPERELKSRRPEPSTAETNIHAFLFHTALLRRLSSSINSLPFRMFVIDSPFTNEIDKENEKDITKFLNELPGFLPNYQIVITSASTEGFESSTFASEYDMKKYPSQGQADLAQFED